MLIFLFFFILWLLFNGRVTPDVVGFGIFMSAVITFFAVKICGWNARKTSTFLKIFIPLLAYFACLVVEIIKANLAVIGVILSPKGRAMHPQIFAFDSKLHKDFLQTIMANSITITPGTYTLAIDHETLTVHALNSDFAEGTPGSPLNLRLQAMEEKLNSIDPVTEEKQPDGAEAAGEEEKQHE